MSSVPTMFYAYPGQPADVAETIEGGIAEINQSDVIRITGWKEVKNVGRLVVDEILQQIDNASMFGCDLTVLNNNVLFELGYAIGKGRRIWISVSETIDADRRGVRKIESLLPVGQARYVNQSQFVTQLYAEQPWNDLDATVVGALGSRSPLRLKGASLLYLKSSLPTDASIRLSQVLDSSPMFDEYTTDDPAEGPSESLDWYFQKVRRADAVVVHLASNSNKSSESHNAKCSLVAGMAVGMNKPLLMLAHAPFETPLDYRSMLKVHDNAAGCRTFAEQWLMANASAIRERQNMLREIYINRKASSDLARLSVGEIVAENEKQTLDDYFLETAAYRQAVRGQQTIFVGRKGTGKTANFYAVASALDADTRNHVCVIKPVSYELDGIVNLLQSTLDRAERGYLVESLWKYLLYTELARSVVDELKRRPSYHQHTEGEQRLLDLAAQHQELVELPFSIRLQRAVTTLGDIEASSGTEETRARVSQGLHENFLSRLRAVLGAALVDRERVAILVDNLDKIWGEETEVEILALLLFGLLSVAGRVSEEFQAGSTRRPGANVTLAVFLRSDIFAVIQDIAREPDKLTPERITWNNPDLLMRVVDNRLVYSWEEDLPSRDIWHRFFVDQIEGTPTRNYVGKLVIPRPRDAIFLVRESLAQAINRDHATVEPMDLAAAYQEYSQYAFKALLVEDDPRIGRLEEVLYEFAGDRPLLTRSQIESKILTAGVSTDYLPRYFNTLLDTNFLGIQNAHGEFDYPVDESSRKLLQRVAQQVSNRSGTEEAFEVNRVFRPVLQIE